MFDRGLVDPGATLAKWHERPFARLKAEFFCLLLIVVPHKYNNNTRKYATLLFVLIWGVMRVLILSTSATPPPIMSYIDGLVLLIVGKMWGIESAIMQSYATVKEPGSNNDDSGKDQ